MAQKIGLRGDTLTALVASLSQARAGIAEAIRQIESEREGASGIVTHVYSIAGQEYEIQKSERREFDSLTRKLMDEMQTLCGTYESIQGVLLKAVQALEESDAKYRAVRAKLGA